MEDQVPFKAYAFWSGQPKPEVRRFGVEKSVVTSFHYLTAKLQDVYPGLRNKSYTVAWKDEDGDDVIISSDEEIMIALGQMHADPIKLYVHCKETATADEEPKDDECEILLQAFPAAAFVGPSGDNAEHFGVTCDGCDNTVVGFRYKCASCPDYDLCSKCEAAGKHSAHCMVRIPVPTMPHAIIKAAIKRSRQFLKSIAVKDECTFKKHKREKSMERKQAREEHHQHHQHHQHQQQHQHRERRERRECRRPRGSWLETFATYMNEFANLAGDVDCHPPAPAPAPAPADGNTPPGAENTFTNAPSASVPTSGDGPTVPVIPFDKIVNPENMKYLMDLQKTLTNILVSNLPAQEPGQPEQPGQPGQPGQPEQPRQPEESVDADVDMGRQGRNSAESDKCSVRSGTSSGSEAKFADSTSEKADDWTMINKENEMMDVAGARPTAPESAPIGFNLPQEFQQRVNIAGDGQNIYPPLNIATAVLDPKAQQLAAAYSQSTSAPVQASQAQPTAGLAQPTPAQAQPIPAQEQPKPAQAQQKPTKPHIAKALNNMLAMGFNNDSGWLTQLLENYDGNISAVIDLLTPVHPKQK